MNGDVSSADVEDGEWTMIKKRLMLIYIGRIYLTNLRPVQEGRDQWPKPAAAYSSEIGKSDFEKRFFVSLIEKILDLDVRLCYYETPW